MNDKLEFFLNTIINKPVDQTGEYNTLLVINCFKELENYHHPKEKDFIEKIFDEKLFENQNNYIILSQINALELAKSNQELTNIIFDKLNEIKAIPELIRFIFISIENLSSSVNFFVTILVNKLNDTNEFVRSKSAKAIVSVLANSNINIKIINQLLPIITELAKDTNENVRSKSAKAIVSVLANSNINIKIINQLLPIITELAKDTNLSVRLSLSKAIGRFLANHNINIKIINQLFPIITKLAKDTNEFVRLSSSGAIIRILANSNINIEIINQLFPIIRGSDSVA